MENGNSRQEKHRGILPILIEDELKTSFLEYAMSVVVSRAIPDIRDGLKPVHRRVLYTMHRLGFHYNKPYHKSVRVVGDVLGRYHPHGDSAVYNTMVGMVQDFSKRYPLLDGQGNWGSVDGDNAAAMRYTEIRMAKISGEILADLDKNTVDFVPNYDGSTTEPTVLPSVLPNLLINGTSGIAVGMATSIPPHNLNEVVSACIALLDNENLSEEKLFELVPAPDFPTGGIICGRAGIVRAYRTGRGNLILRGVVEVENTKKGDALIVTELPYQVNKAALIIKIADLVKDKVIEGISNIRDESNKKGMRLVIELKRGEIPHVVLNQLFQYTQLQTSVSLLLLGLLENRPLIFTLRQLLMEFLHHREDVVFKRTQFDLEKAQDREHLLIGFIIALQNIDEVVALIKASKTPEEALLSLHQRFLLTDAQSRAILDMRLQRLTGLEQEKIHTEMDELKKSILYLQSIIADRAILRSVIRDELVALQNSYADARRTRIEGAIDILTEADLIPEEDVVVTLTAKGYVKRVPLEIYGVQRRGGRGKMGMPSLEDDIIQDVFVAKTHDELLFFTNFGRVYSLTVFEVPEGSRIAKGRAVVNLLPLQPGEHVVKLLCADELLGKFLVLVTRAGTIKRTDAMAFAKIRATGIRAISLHDKDELVFCSLSSGHDTIVLATAKGQGIHFKEEEVRQMGRQAAGVIGIRMRDGDYVVGMEVVSDLDQDLLFATQRGYGKRVKSRDFRISHRGGLGVRTIPTDKRNGIVIGLALVSELSNILLIDAVGKIIRLSPKEVRTIGRQAKGVRLIRLEPHQELSSIVAFEESAVEEDENKGEHEPVMGIDVVKDNSDMQSDSEFESMDHALEEEQDELKEETGDDSFDKDSEDEF
ncbi:MAG TPA: DNA gyrase subunit A [Candidatus Babeliales bacterium]|nr:DNA gyrase subunit A [Candidatus Babeliales bacterium]